MGCEGDCRIPDSNTVDRRIVCLGQMIVCPVVVGGGKRFFPDGVRLDLERVEERRFRKGVVVLRYAVRG